MTINQQIFKTYDIRGNYPKDFNQEIAYLVGQAFCLLTGANKLMVGCDNRPGSDPIKKSIVEGILDSGVDVVDIGQVSTPQLYFSTASHNVSNALMITASHSAGHESGVKFVHNNLPLHPEQVIELKNMVVRGEFEKPNKKGQYEKADYTNEYIRKLKDLGGTDITPCKVAIDPGNGVLVNIVEKVFDNIGIEPIYINMEDDGTFPNRGPNPKLPESQKLIKEKILEEKADFGFMWDSDGDRFYVLDSTAEVIAPQFVAALLGEYLVPKSYGNKMTIEVRTGQVVKDLVEAVGGEIIVLPAWHAEIKQAMGQDDDIVLGSETSGHYVFRDMFRSDDGLLTALVFLQAVSAKKESFQKTHQQLKDKYFVIEEQNFKYSDDPELIYNDLAEEYNNGKVNFVDGITVQYPKWRFNLRASRTEPLLRLNLDSTDHKLGKQKLAQLTKTIQNLIR